MKNIKYLLFSLFLILSFSIKVDAATKEVDDDFNPVGYINGTQNYFYGSNHTFVGLNTGVEPNIRINLNIYTHWPYVNGSIQSNLVNPKGTNFYIVLNVCTTEPSAFGAIITPQYDVTGDFTYIKEIANNVGSACLVNGYQGNIITKSIEISVNKTTENLEVGMFTTTGSIVYWGGKLTTYPNSIKIISIHVMRSTDKTYEIIEIQKKIEKDNRNWLQKLTDLPRDLWNFIKQIPSQVWGFFSSAFDFVASAIGDVGDFIIDLPSGIWNLIKSGFNWIVSGLSDLGTFILNGLEELFIPTDLSVSSLVDTFQNKLGFIYDVPAAVISYGLNLSNISFLEMNSISLPTITIFGHNFWQSQNIDISASINTFKPFRYLTSIACVSLCVNALFKYKDKIFGGGGNYN